jgi:hypothetical protein
MVIVVKDELGAINQALLSIEAAKKHKLNIAMLAITIGKLMATAKSLFNTCCAMGEYSPPAPSITTKSSLLLGCTALTNCNVGAQSNNTQQPRQC